MRKTILLFACLAFFQFENKAQTVTDIDGNIYNVITIGNQKWLGENLKVTHYRNGDLIPNITNDVSWSNLYSGAYCDYNNVADNSVTYGRLYNLHAVIDARNIAPEGWHIASGAELATLSAYLGGDSVSGGKLKETGTSHWISPNTGATNESDFTALPGGLRLYDGSFHFLGEQCNLWTCSWGSGMAVVGVIVNNAETFVTTIYHFYYGFSVRCVKDIGAGVGNNTILKKIIIYPNPSCDRLTVHSPFENRYAILSIYDLMGNVVLRTQIEQAENTLNIGTLVKGMYILEISNSQTTLKEKLIKL